MKTLIFLFNRKPHLDARQSLHRLNYRNRLPWENGRRFDLLPNRNARWNRPTLMNVIMQGEHLLVGESGDVLPMETGQVVLDASRERPVPLVWRCVALANLEPTE